MEEQQKFTEEKELVLKKAKTKAKAKALKKILKKTMSLIQNEIELIEEVDVEFSTGDSPADSEHSTISASSLSSMPQETLQHKDDDEVKILESIEPEVIVIEDEELIDEDQLIREENEKSIHEDQLMREENEKSIERENQDSTLDEKEDSIQGENQDNIQKITKKIRE